MKSYTDIEQSKKLAGILPPESADMHYWKRTWKENDYAISVGHSKELQEGFESKCIEYIPCWSLAALFGVLPTTIGNFFEKNALRLRMDKGENDFNIWYENFDCGDVAEGLDVTENNPIDACFEMFIKLNKQKLL